jgi:hypothetical protein
MGRLRPVDYHNSLRMALHDRSGRGASRRSWSNSGTGLTKIALKVPGGAGLAGAGKATASFRGLVYGWRPMPPRDRPPNQPADIGGKALTCANVSDLLRASGGNAVHHAPRQLNPYTSPRKLAGTRQAHQPSRPRPIRHGLTASSTSRQQPNPPAPASTAIRHGLGDSRTCRQQPNPTLPAVPSQIITAPPTPSFLLRLLIRTQSSMLITHPIVAGWLHSRPAKLAAFSTGTDISAWAAGSSDLPQVSPLG